MKQSKQSVTLLSYILLFFTSFFIVAQSFAAPWNKVEFGVDAASFSYIGWAMKQGLIPYIDLWDNKGPLLYFIEFIGANISEQHGIFILEFISIIISSVYMYITAKLFFGRVVSCLASVFCILLLAKFLEGGNLCEEFALPFICFALYLLTKFFKQDLKIYWYQSICIGISVAACALIRINLMTPILSYCCLIFIYSLLLKKWKGSLLLIPNFIIGIAIATLPFIVFLWTNNALGACISAAYTMTFKTNLYSITQRIENMYNLISAANISYALLIFTTFVICFILTIIIDKKRNSKANKLGTCVIIAFVLNTIANMISGPGYLHYFLSSIPLFILPVAIGFNYIYCFINHSISSGSYFSVHDRFRKYFASFVIIFLLLFASWGSIDYNIKLIFQNYQLRIDDVANIVNTIKKNTTPQDVIISYGFDSYQPIIMRTSYRKSGTRFFYSPTWSVFNDEFIANVKIEIASDIRVSQPKLVLIKKDLQNDLFVVDSSLENFISQNYDILAGDFPLNYIIYKRNE